MDGLLALVVIEQRLEFVHQLPVPGDGAGGQDHRLGVDDELAARVLALDARHRAGVVQDQVLACGLVIDLTAACQEVLQQLVVMYQPPSPGPIIRSMRVPARSHCHLGLVIMPMKPFW